MTDRSGVEIRRRAAAQVLVAPEHLDGHGPVPLADEVEHHLRRVVRLAEGAEVSVTDGEGRWLIAGVRHERGGLLLVPGTELATEPRPAGVRIATAIPKGDRVDWLMQKATELGVGEVVLLHAQRSVVRWTAARADRQLARLRRISDEALRQCRRVWRMGITGPVDAAGLLPDAVLAEPGGRALLASDDLIAVGPEGGWADEELTLAADRVDLGDAILRTETAVVAAATFAAALRR